jgi:hypothetical protein
MNFTRKLFFGISHSIAVLCGFGLGVYLLPILTAPPAPAPETLAGAVAAAQFTGQFRRGLKDSDIFHWGEGTLSVSRAAIALQGRIAPGPDYRLYLSPDFVETETDFERLKPHMVQVGEVKTFENFLVNVPAHINPADYNTAIVWCESFAQFIIAAQYR